MTDIKPRREIHSLGTKFWSDLVYRESLENTSVHYIFGYTAPPDTRSRWLKALHKVRWYLWRKWAYRLGDWIHRDCDSY